MWHMKTVTLKTSEALPNGPGIAQHHVRPLSAPAKFGRWAKYPIHSSCSAQCESVTKGGVRLNNKIIRALRHAHPALIIPSRYPLKEDPAIRSSITSCQFNQVDRNINE